MPNSFKSDESFLRKLALGAAATNATMVRLKELGFNPIELERGSTGFKIWKKIKIKRVRVPDILCLDTGLRFESRGKTKLEISMSHSLKDPKRSWDIGMKDEDSVSIIVFDQEEDSPVALRRLSPVHFVGVRDLRAAFANDQVIVTQPKGVEEGSEIRVLWPSAGVPERTLVLAVEPSRIRVSSISDARTKTIQLDRQRGKISMTPQVKQGHTAEANQILAAVVPVHVELTPPGPVGEDYYIDRLHSVNLTERYAAAKGLRYRGYTSGKAVLEERMNDADEDIYVQLEAAAALAAHDDTKAWNFIEGKLRGSSLNVPLETQLETIIVLSEIRKQRSEQLLVEVLEATERHDELRAGAAWALGEFPSPTSATALVSTFNSSPLEVKVESARALLRIAEPQVRHLVGLLKAGDSQKREGISWALARTGGFRPSEVIVGADDNLRRWMSYIVGYGKDRFEEADIESICKADSQVYFAASVLWQILSSWVNDLKEF